MANSTENSGGGPITATGFIIADSGAREHFGTGAVRDSQTGKGRFDLIPPTALRRLAGIYQGGANKYAARNWEQGFPFSRLLDSLKRHINDYELIQLYIREGIPLTELPSDVNPNEDHLAHGAFNLFGLLHFDEVRPDLNDLGIPNKLTVTVEPPAENVEFLTHLGEQDVTKEDIEERLAQSYPQPVEEPEEPQANKTLSNFLNRFKTPKP